MKKILYLLGLLVTYNLSLANTENLTLDSDESGAITEKVKISANVISSLAVEVQSVEFGNIAKGATKGVPNNGEGYVKVAGEQGEVVKVFLRHPDTQNNLLVTKESLYLYPKGTKNGENDIVEYKPFFYSTNSGYVTERGEIVLSDNIENNKIVIGGTATANNQASLGEYSREVEVVVEYQYEPIKRNSILEK